MPIIRGKCPIFTRDISDGEPVSVQPVSAQYVHIADSVGTLAREHVKL